MVAISQHAGSVDMLSVDSMDMASSGTTAEGSPPKVLLITAYHWPTTTRLALALSEAGLAVEALCPQGHSLAQVKFVSRTYRYGALRPLRSLHKAITASKPDLLIPCDDTAAAQLHALHSLTDAADPASNKLRSVIAHSLGDPANFPIFYSRARIASLAHVAGVLSPATTNICNQDELFTEIDSTGLPAVLKTDGSFGGMGVAIIRTRAEAKRAFAKLGYYNGVTRALKRLIVNRDANVILPCLRRTCPQLTIQRYLFGKLATVAVACWKGTILAQVCVEVIASHGATGAATVVSVISNPGMSQAIERLVRVLNLSGLCGFDFILDSTDGSAHLIDFNPRATQTCHLLSCERTQPVLWLAAKLRGLPPIVDDHLSPHCGPIVLFPHRPAYSQKFTEIDLSSKSPELVKIGLEFHQRKNRFLAKAFRLASQRREC
jgi:hypothetical protein